ncbi:MAG: hypothetical protein N2444_06140, partial [Methylocystis sp.]|nr:hypothetical protein [Methylocystis sp.]
MTTSPDSAIHAASSRPGVGKWRRITVVLSHLVAAAFLATNVCATEKRSAKGEQKLYEGYCANIAVGAEMARVERQKKLIAEMEGRLKNQIEALEAREKSLQAIVE